MEHHSIKKFSLTEFDKLIKKDNIKYELIDTILFMSPRPNYKHQEIMGNLYLEIGNYLKGMPCKVFTEAEIELNENVIIPDISVICGLENTNFQRYKKAPDLVIEILSDSSRYTDGFIKLNKYQLFGVKEYWIVNPKTEIISIYNFLNKTNIEFTKSEQLKSSLFNDLEIDLKIIFL